MVKDCCTVCMYGKTLRELNQFSLENKRLGVDFIAAYKYVTREYSEDGVRLFPEVHSNRLRSKEHNLVQGKDFSCSARVFKY